MRDPLIGQEIDGWRLVQVLGAGGMGVVYRAERLGARYALKLVRGDIDPEVSARFLREARVMAAVDRHRHIARVFSVGRFRGRPYLVMELLEGGDLRATLKALGQGDADDARRLLGPIASALRFIHARGLVHRDLKPENILMRAGDGEPVLTDFGLVKDQSIQGLTRTGVVLGTPAYMAPEQFDSAEFGGVGPPADVWAFSVVLYELLSGRRPYPVGSPFQIYSAILAGPPALPSRSAGPQLTSLCLRGLRRLQAERPSIAELEAALHEPELEKSPRSLSLPLILSLVLLTILGASAALLLAPSPEPEPAPVARPKTPSAPAIRLSIERFIDGVVYLPEAALSGRVEGQGLTLRINEALVALGPDGRFAYTFEPRRKPRRLRLVARDDRGGVAAVTALAQVFDKAVADRLSELERWRSSSPQFQDEALLAIARRVDGRLEYLGRFTFDRVGRPIALGRFRHRRSGVELHLLPGGSFRIGVADIGAEREALSAFIKAEKLDGLAVDLEAEAGGVEIDIKPFFMARCELSRGEARRLGFEDSTWGDRDELPAGNLKLGAFLEKLPADPRDLRLPSESEWEYACRAGARTRFFWGEEPDRIDEFSAHKGNCEEIRSTRLLAERDAVNGFGLADVVGHVREACCDPFFKDRAAIPRDGRPHPRNPAFTSNLVARGGDRADGPFWLRSTARESAELNTQRTLLGFRLAMDLPP